MYRYWEIDKDEKIITILRTDRDMKERGMKKGDKYHVKEIEIDKTVSTQAPSNTIEVIFKIYICEEKNIYDINHMFVIRIK